ncbi:MAG TPA: substrate-binding domain-containing protein [Actinocrinis sp.]|nr:substrate-binding domain-containing protein [Actinocrinis sp.]
MLRKTVLTATAGAAVIALGLAGCSSSSSTKTSGASAAPSNTKVGVLLPDTVSAIRWTSADPDELNSQCLKYKLNCTIDNANGSDSEMEAQATQMINAGVGVLIIADLDATSGDKIEQQAKAAGVTVIDYDRLDTGGTAQYYVSFDNVAVGKAQATALQQCSQVASLSSVKWVELDGAPTDNNATLFKQGYAPILTAKWGAPLADQAIANWTPATAGTTFQTMLNQYGSQINAVMVANDGMAGPVEQAIAGAGLTGKIAVTGQDASPAGLDAIMSGAQCLTVYKPVAGEADIAIQIADQVLSGKTPASTIGGEAATTVKDPTTGREVPSYLAAPIAITKANVALPVTQGYETAAAVCGVSQAIATLCNSNGITYTYTAS